MLNRTHPLLIVSLLLFFALAAGCSSGGGILPEGDDESNVLEAASFEGGDNFVDLTDEGLTLALTDDNGNPLPDVEVYLDGELADYTDEGGKYTLYGLTEEDSELRFAIEGIDLFTTTINSVSRNAQYSDPDPDIERGKVFGIVKDIDGPVFHALVLIVKGQHFAFDWTGPEGGYVIDDAPVGPGVILCFAKQHKPYADGIVVFPDDPVQKNIWLKKCVDFAQLGGLVLDGHLWPVKHAKVTYLHPDMPPKVTFTNKYGAYGFPKLPVGPGIIKIEAFGFHDGGGPVNLHPGKNLKHWQIHRLPFGGIEGIVMGTGPNIPEPVPLPGATVLFIKHIEGHDKPIVLKRITNDEGKYRFNFLPLGPCVMKAGKPGWSMEIEPSFVAEGEWHVENFLLHKNPPDDGGG